MAPPGSGPLAHTLIPVPCESIFGTIEGYAARVIVPVDRAVPGDFLGIVLEISAMMGKYPGYNHAYTTHRFIIMGSDGPEVERFDALPEARKDIAARLSVEASLVHWSEVGDFHPAIDALENDEAGLTADIYLMPNLGIMACDNWEEHVYDFVPEETPKALNAQLRALRRPVSSNHEAIARHSREAGDLEALNCLFRIQSDPDDETAPLIEFALPPPPFALTG